MMAALICLRLVWGNEPCLKSFQKKSKIAGKLLSTHRIYKFDTFSLDATAKVLLRDGQPVTMTRKAVETLLVLTENAGQVVPKDELLKTIWPDRVVEEANLTQNIAMVRRALAVERGSAAYIETFPGRGYRLIGPVALDTPEPPQAKTDQASFSLNSSELPVEPIEQLPPATLQPTSSPSKKWPVVLLIAAAATGLLGWFLLQRNSPAVEAVFHITSLTRLAGKEWQPALSPDSQKLAFVAEQDEDQPPEIRVQVEGSNNSQRISPVAGHYTSPAWSPDGQALAYLRIGKEATEVLTTALHSDGSAGTERVVTRFTPPNYGYPYRLLDWSPDGRWLAVSHSETPGKPNGLFLVNLATGEKTSLTKPADLVGGDLDPHFSPDGKQITFVRHIHRSHQELYAIPVTGGEARPLTADAKQISSHDWASDGSVVFASDRGGEFRLWRLHPKITEADKRLQRIEIFSSFPMEVSVARSAARLAYSVQQQDRNIWRLDLKDKQWTRVVASSAQDASPQYSPDGGKICFRSDRSGTEQLWIGDANGNDQTQLTKGELYPSVGHWSPDGRRIVFNNARSGEIYVAELKAAGDWQVRSTGINGVHPIFAPDGQWIFAGTTQNIFKFPVAGGQPTTVVNTGGFSMSLSQDGQRLYFKREQNDAVLWQANTATGELTRALDGLLPTCTSCWSLTPTGIYYLGSDKSSFDAQAIYFHRFSASAGEADRLIVKYPEPLAPVGSGPFSLSPDLRSLLCVRMNKSNSDIMQVEPFR